jgi:hypothetical protein
MVVFSYKPLPGAEAAIYQKISDITVSMKARDYLKMPDLVSVTEGGQSFEKGTEAV